MLGGRGTEQGAGGGEMAQTMYAHLNKRIIKKNTCHMIDIQQKFIE
jgi:hypothetical protein